MEALCTCQEFRPSFFPWFIVSVDTLIEGILTPPESLPKIGLGVIINLFPIFISMCHLNMRQERRNSSIWLFASGSKISVVSIACSPSCSFTFFCCSFIFSAFQSLSPGHWILAADLSSRPWQFSPPLTLMQTDGCWMSVMWLVHTGPASISPRKLLSPLMAAHLDSSPCLLASKTKMLSWGEEIHELPAQVLTVPQTLWKLKPSGMAF